MLQSGLSTCTTLTRTLVFVFLVSVGARAAELTTREHIELYNEVISNADLAAMKKTPKEPKFFDEIDRKHCLFVFISFFFFFCIVHSRILLELERLIALPLLCVCVCATIWEPEPKIVSSIDIEQQRERKTNTHRHKLSRIESEMMPMGSVLLCCNVVSLYDIVDCTATNGFIAHCWSCGVRCAVQRYIGPLFA